MRMRVGVVAGTPCVIHRSLDILSTPRIRIYLSVMKPVDDLSLLGYDHKYAKTEIASKGEGQGYL
jgi:hypothetical protein